MINYTISLNSQNDQLNHHQLWSKNSGISEAGTWVYTDECEGDVQYLAYDYYGYYTDDSGYQLSLVDFDYVAQPGDTWYSIARRHGMPVVDLLALNRAIAEDRILPDK